MENMLENWLLPIKTEEGMAYHQQWGKRVKIFSEELPDLEDVKIAMIGGEEEECAAIREELYQLSFPFGRLKMVDLGNLKKVNADFSGGLLKHLLAENIIPVVFGKSSQVFSALIHAYHDQLEALHLGVIDKYLPVAPGYKDDRYYLNPLFKNYWSNGLHIEFMACQGHYIFPKGLGEIEHYSHSLNRLGAVQQNLMGMEPILRNMDCLGLNIGAIRYAEAQGQPHPSPSGLLLEEACQLARFAGISDKLSSFCLFGYDYKLDERNITAKTMAMLVWYFIEGVVNRKKDFPISTHQMVEYIVNLDGNNLTFWKSKVSDRWWVELPKHGKHHINRHRLIPCGYDDYVTASHGSISDFLWKHL